MQDFQFDVTRAGSYDTTGANRTAIDVA